MKACIPVLMVVGSRDLTGAFAGRIPTQDMYRANLVILHNSTHFRCIKNRWEDTGSEDDRIPLKLLKLYLMQYAEHFTAENYIDSILP